MRRLNITPAEVESVCGRMVACRAAECNGQQKPDTDLGTLLYSAFIFIRRYISQPVMPTLQIIKTVNIIDNISNALTSGFIATVINPLRFQAAKEPLRNGIIQTITLAAHTTSHIQFLLAGLELGAGILRSLITMEYDRACWASFINRQS